MWNRPIPPVIASVLAAGATGALLTQRGSVLGFRSMADSRAHAMPMVARHPRIHLLVARHPLRGLHPMSHSSLLHGICAALLLATALFNCATCFPTIAFAYEISCEGSPDGTDCGCCVECGCWHCNDVP